MTNLTVFIKTKSNMILHSLERLGLYHIIYESDDTYDQYVINLHESPWCLFNRSISCHRMIDINGIGVLVRLTCNTPKRINDGYIQFRLYSLGLHIQLNDMLYHIFDIRCNEVIKQDVYNSYITYKPWFYEVCNDLQKDTLKKAYDLILLSPNPFFTFFDDIVSQEISYHIQCRGI